MQQLYSHHIEEYFEILQNYIKTNGKDYKNRKLSKII